jgi:hypothetical protein
MSGLDPLRAVAQSYFSQECGIVPKEQELQVFAVIDRALGSDDLGVDEANSLISAILGRPIDFMNKIYRILSVPDLPPPVRRLSALDSETNRKSNPWSSVEDARLLAAIHRFGSANWTAVAEFVGHGRTRAQCSQRWSRGLDPRLKKAPWTAEEESQLRDLVAQYGLKAWTRIATQMSNRSDVQCRYQYRRLMKQSNEVEELLHPKDQAWLSVKDPSPVSSQIGLETTRALSFSEIFGSQSTFSLPDGEAFHSADGPFF